MAEPCMINDLIWTGSDLRFLCGRYWDRTSDLLGVNKENACFLVPARTLMSALTRHFLLRP